MLGKGLESLIPPQKKGDGAPADSPRDDAVRPAVPSADGEAGIDEGHAEPPAAADEYIKPPEPAAPAAEPASGENTHAAPAAPFTRPLRAPGGEEAVFQIETDKINPNPHQPRRVFDEGALRDLAASIREFGILQPIVVSKIEKESPHGVEVEYQLIAGERRLMASKLLGLERVPAIVRKVDVEQEKLEMAIIENLQRENLSPIEMGRAFQRLQEEFRLTQREIAARLGKSREVVANTVRLLDLPPRIQDAISKGEITESHGRLLLAVDDMEAQQKLFDDLVSRHLSTRELRMRVSEKKERRASEPAMPDIELRALQEKLRQELGTPVVISKNGQSGKITINFYSKEELEHILRKMGAAGEGGEPPIA